jgi:deazaflavin-dependent oxidoreductase (nitroreductase family)
MSRSPHQYQVIQPVEKFLVNPPVKLAWRLGCGPPGDALLEPIGRRTGRTRGTPICDGQEGDTFWLVVHHGRRTDYVRNIEANLRVRVRTDSHAAWRTGMAYILDDDDSNDRLRKLEPRRSSDSAVPGRSKAMSTNLLTLRIDLVPL